MGSVTSLSGPGHSFASADVAFFPLSAWECNYSVCPARTPELLTYQLCFQQLLRQFVIVARSALGDLASMHVFLQF